MRLAAIYNIWDGVELLKGSIDLIKDHIDLLIIIHQDISNRGEKYDPLPEISDCLPHGIYIKLIKYHPTITKDRRNGMINEARKRNAGLSYAKDDACTHFVMLDCDEYHPDFKQAKDDYIKSGQDGSVLRMWTYFKSPNLRLENIEGYHVPFIHKLKPDTIVGNFPYPYRVDPTRAVNTTKVVELPQMMHHYSWVRKDIEKKARNSSANHLSQHLEDYHNAKAGMYIGCYAQNLIEVECTSFSPSL